MKIKDLAFYAVAALSLGLFMLLPFATGFSFGEDMPGWAFCLEWIKAGEQFVFSMN